MKNIVSRGETIAFTAASAVTSGDPVAIGSIVGIAVADVANGAEGVAHVCGVYELPKTNAAIAQGEKVFLTGGGSISATEAGNTFAGYAWAAGAEGDATIAVKLTSAS